MELSLNPFAFAYMYFFFCCCCHFLANKISLSQSVQCFFFFSFLFFINGNSISRLIFTSYKRCKKSHWHSFQVSPAMWYSTYLTWYVVFIRVAFIFITFIFIRYITSWDCMKWTMSLGEITTQLIAVLKSVNWE